MSSDPWQKIRKTAAIAYLGKRAGDRIRLITRGGYDWTERYPRIVEAALKNRHREFVIDGEAPRI